MKFFRKLITAQAPAVAKHSASNYALRTALGALAFLALCPGGFSQQSPPVQQRLELPVIFRQKVIAGATPVGATVEVRLQIATLVSGVVVPRGATLSGQVAESVKKTADAPSRLKIKFDAAKWKNGAAPIEVYFTGCYYPLVAFNERNTNDASYGSISQPADAGDGQYPPPPGPRPGQIPQGFGPDVPQPMATRVSSHWVRQEGTTLMGEADGSMAVTSAARDLKLDKDTTYLLTNYMMNAAPAAKH